MIDCNETKNNWSHGRKKITSSSKFKGVSWHKSRNKWRAYINLDNIQYHLGYFNDEIEAAKAYNIKAEILYKQFACLNTL